MSILGFKFCPDCGGGMRKRRDTQGNIIKCANCNGRGFYKPRKPKANYDEIKNKLKTKLL